MKTLKKLLVLILVVLFNVSIVKANEFIPHIDLVSFDGNYLSIVLWYEGAPVSEIEHTIKYDYNYLELYQTSGDVYSSSVTNVGTTDNYKTDKLYANTLEDNNNATYATVTFKVKDAFSINKTIFLRFEDIVATSSDNLKYKSDSLVATVRRDSVNSVYFYQEYLNENIERDIWLNDHIVNIVITIFTVIFILALFLIAPTNFATRKKTSVSLKKKINKKPKKKSIERLELNPDKISEIGRKKKPEPKNKLELGSYDPLAKNKGKKR